MLVREANSADPDQILQKQSDQGLRCLSRPFKQVTTCFVFKFQNIYSKLVLLYQYYDGNAHV